MPKSSFKDLINSSQPVLVDVFATWCGPCKAMTPVLKELSSEIGEKVRIIKVDIDNNREFAANYGIQGVPTFMLFKEGKLLWRQSGMLPKGQLKQVIEKNL